MQQAQVETARFRDPAFDHYFIWAIPLIALGAAFLVLAGVIPFEMMLALDLSVLGYHHVMSTFSRFTFDAESATQNRKLLIYAPLLVFPAVLGLAMTFGPWLIATIYLHWQWFHYTRQSEGISKAFGFKTVSAQAGDARWNRALFYMTPITCLLMLSHRQPAEFLYMELFTLPVPIELVYAAAAVNIVLFVPWLYRQAMAVAAGTMNGLHLVYFLSHHGIFLFAYVLMTDINLGWLAINTWHNMQYIAFVWVCNVNLHKGGYNPKRPVISWLSQPRRAVIYLAAFFFVAMLFYDALGALVNTLISPANVLLASIIIYQSINFHHYIVDSVIWKLRKKTVQAAIGVEH